LEVSDAKGSMTEVYLGLEYLTFKHFALGAAYDYLSVNADYQKGRGRLESREHLEQRVRVRRAVLLSARLF
jgi:hypothetical protein